jgi:hypothetical protein
MKDSFYKKDFTPGYQGHVPKKVEMCGMTQGEMNRVANGISTR